MDKDESKLRPREGLGGIQKMVYKPECTQIGAAHSEFEAMIVCELRTKIKQFYSASGPVRLRSWFTWVAGWGSRYQLEEQERGHD